MGAFAAVAQGSDQEPRADHPALRGPGRDRVRCSGFVGKAVTFDTGGISIKPAATMHEMKFDMSGGAAVHRGHGRDRAPAPAGPPRRRDRRDGEHAGRERRASPGDIVRAKNGTTIEINNTDAEGRLVLADCLD